MKAKITQQTWMWRLVIGLALMLSSGFTLAVSVDKPGDGLYTSKDREYYLSSDEIFFIRPGLELEILGVTIPADRQPEVTFMLTDPGGLPLDRNGVTTPGAVSTSFILSYIPEGEEAYVAYTTRVQTSPITGDSATQASTDSGGEYTDLGAGQYLYKFATVLPSDYDANVTHTLGIYARRDLQEYDLDRYVTNELEHFIPSGNGVAVPRDIVTTETCNGRCHDPLALHGGAREEVGLCVLCHNPTQGIDPDTGNTVDFKSMVHKIHRGGDLEEPLVIIGFGQAEHDFGHVEFPAEINDCEICHTGGTPTEAFPMVASPNPAPVCDMSKLGISEVSWDYPERFQIHMNSPDGTVFATANGAGSKATNKWVKDGTTFFMVEKDTGEVIQEMQVNTTPFGCVTNPPGTFRGEPGMQHTNWLDHPARVACGSCHDDVDFDTGEGHPGGAQTNDDSCSFCHQPGNFGEEFDRSIRGAHQPLYKSVQFPGVIVNIIDVINTNPGQKPTIIFSLGSKNGPLNPANLDRLRFSITGPNEDFSFYAQETVGAFAVRSGENWSYTFTTPLPLDAAGSFTVGFEGRNEVAIMTDDEIAVEEDQAQDSTFAFAVTDSVAVPRRTVVDDYNCESCHSNLSLHGGNRNNPQYCVTCHRPDATDLEVRPTEELPAESIHFKYMIHKIHSGEELENGYVVYGFRGSLNDFGDIEFPGDLRNCEKCHVDDSYKLPLPDGVLPTTTPRNFWDPTPPMSAACLSCHDSDDAAIHADANTTFFGESCNTCHGEDRDFSVEKVHAR